jgi:hypothetical protein
MKMNALYAALSGVFLLGAATIAPAQKVPSEPAKAVQPTSMENKAAGISGDEYKREKDRVEADAKAAKEACKSMKDNAKDICEAEAKGKEKVAKKELDLKKNPNDKNAQDLEKMKVEVAYEVAKEKCEDLKGADQAACKKTAKADKDRGIAAAKGSKKVAATGTGSMPATKEPTSKPAGNPSGATGGSYGATSGSTGAMGTPSSSATSGTPPATKPQDAASKDKSGGK